MALYRMSSRGDGNKSSEAWTEVPRLRRGHGNVARYLPLCEPGSLQRLWFAYRGGRQRQGDEGTDNAAGHLVLKLRGAVEAKPRRFRVSSLRQKRNGMSGWEQGKCEGCGNHGPGKPVASGWKCTYCIANPKAVDLTVGVGPLATIRCPECREWMDIEDDEFTSIRVTHIAKCLQCGLLIMVDNNGKEIITVAGDVPPAILCSSCGEVLQRDGNCFRCQCGRVVTA